MIEEIKKEINYRIFNLSIGKFIKYDDVLEILDKYYNELDIANNKLKEVKGHCENRINEYNNYKDRGCVDEKDYGIYLNSQKVLLIMGGNDE